MNTVIYYECCDLLWMLWSIMNTMIWYEYYDPLGMTRFWRAKTTKNDRLLALHKNNLGSTILILLRGVRRIPTTL